jgi:hypothetical protein
MMMCNGKESVTHSLTSLIGRTFSLYTQVNKCINLYKLSIYFLLGVFGPHYERGVEILHKAKEVYPKQ